MCSPDKNREYGKTKHHYLKYCEQASQRLEIKILIKQGRQLPIINLLKHVNTTS